MSSQAEEGSGTDGDGTDPSRSSKMATSELDQIAAFIGTSTSTVAEGSAEMEEDGGGPANGEGRPDDAKSSWHAVQPTSTDHAVAAFARNSPDPNSPNAIVHKFSKARRIEAPHTRKFPGASAATGISTSISDVVWYEYQCFGSTVTQEVSKKKASYLFGIDNTLRKFVISYFVVNPWFDLFILLAILANCVTLTLQKEYAEAELFFNIVFTIEWATKMFIGLGVVPYLKDNWNKLDFVVVITGWLGYLGGGANLSFIRSLRVFRAFKSIRSAPGLRFMIAALFDCITEIFHPMVLIAFAVFFVGIFGLHLYSGVLHQRCVCMLDQAVYNYTHEEWYASSTDESNFLDEGMWLCGNSSGARVCPAADKGYCEDIGVDNATAVCLHTGQNPNNDYTSFDHFGWSALTAFQLLTCDWWEDIYNQILMTTGPASIVFFLVAIFLGGFFVINLILAVVSNKYEMTRQEIERENIEKFVSLATNVNDVSKKWMQRAFRGKSQKWWDKQSFTRPSSAASPDSDSGDSDSGDSNLSEESVEEASVDDQRTSLNPMLRVVGQISRLTGDEGVAHSAGGVDFAISKPPTQNSSLAPLAEPSVAQPAGDTDVDSLKTTGTLEDAGDVKTDANTDANAGGLVKGEAKQELPKTKIGRWCMNVVERRNFVMFIIFCIVGNTAVMASWTPYLDKSTTDTLDIFNVVFTFIFLAEALLKIFAYGLKGYLFHTPVESDSVHRSGKGWNRFDAVVVFMSVVEFVVEYVADSNGLGGLSILRTFRLLRILRLGKEWKTMNKILNTIASAGDDLAYLTIILVVVVYTFATMGFQLYREDFSDIHEAHQAYMHGNSTEADPLPRWHFMDFSHSVMMIIRILCGEWIEPLQILFDASGTGGTVMFVLIALLIGNFIIFNLFLAALLYGFELEDEKADREDAIEHTAKMAGMAIVDADDAGAGGNDDAGNVDGDGDGKPADGTASAADEEDGKWSFTKAVRVFCCALCFTKRKNNKVGIGGAVEVDRARSVFKKAKQRRLSTADTEGREPVEVPRMCFNRPASRLERWIKPTRRKAMWLVNTPVWEGIILITVLWSSVMLIFEDKKIRKNDELRGLILIFDLLFAIVFTVEFVVEFFAYGTSFFKSGWNTLDALVVLIAWLAIGVGSQAGLSALRVVRVFRPIKKIPFMRIIVDAIMTSIPAVMNVLVVVGLFWLIFGIVGVQFFGGKFDRCIYLDSQEMVDPEYTPSRLECCADIPFDRTVADEYHLYDAYDMINVSSIAGMVESRLAAGETRDDFDGGSFSLCFNNNKNVTGGSSGAGAAPLFMWFTPNINFDNIINSYGALYQVATFEGWMAVMDSGVDAVGVGMQPIYENQVEAYVFFVVFIIFGSFFTLSLFIGVVIENFQNRKAKMEEAGEEGGVYLTPTQRAYLRALRLALTRKPIKPPTKPTGKFSAWCWKVSLSQTFELVILSLILLNGIFLAMKHEGQSETMTAVLWAVNAVCVGIFSLEVVIKLIGLRLAYFRDGWNKFDFVITVVSLVMLVFEIYEGAVLENAGGAAASAGPAVRLLRILRVFRLFRLIKRFQKIRKLALTLIISLPSLVNIAFFLLVLIFIFAIIGMALFKDVIHNSGALNNYINFETFGSSFLLVFRLSTSAGWDEVLEACSVRVPYCDPNFFGDDDGVGNCGQPNIANAYFSLLVLVVTMVVIETYVAVILENLDIIYDEETSDQSTNSVAKIEVTADNIDGFYESWSKFDLNANQFIAIHELGDVLDGVPYPLGWKGIVGGCTAQDVRKLRIKIFHVANTDIEQDGPRPKSAGRRTTWAQRGVGAAAVAETAKIDALAEASRDATMAAFTAAGEPAPGSPKKRRASKAHVDLANKISKITSAMSLSEDGGLASTADGSAGKSRLGDVAEEFQGDTMVVHCSEVLTKLVDRLMDKNTTSDLSHNVVVSRADQKVSRAFPLLDRLTEAGYKTSNTADISNVGVQFKGVSATGVTRL